MEQTSLSDQETARIARSGWSLAAGPTRGEDRLASIFGYSGVPMTSPSYSQLVRWMFEQRHHDAHFNVSYFDLFVHGVNANGSVFFSLGLANEIAAANAVLARWDDPTGFEDPVGPFVYSYSSFLVDRGLVNPDAGLGLIGKRKTGQAPFLRRLGRKEKGWRPTSPGGPPAFWRPMRLGSVPALSFPFARISFDRRSRSGRGRQRVCVRPWITAGHSAGAIGC